MDTNTGESPGHQSQSQQLGNSPSEEEMVHWTPTGIEPMVYDDDDDSYVIILSFVIALFLLTSKLLLEGRYTICNFKYKLLHQAYIILAIITDEAKEGQRVCIYGQMGG